MSPLPRGAMRPSGCKKTSRPENQRAQGRPGARCTRGLVCKMHKKKRTRAYRFSGNTPAFPAQWFYGLCRDLPGDEFVLASVIGGLKVCSSPVGPTRLRRLDTSNGCQDQTVLPYASVSVVRMLSSLTGNPPCDFNSCPTLPRPSQPAPTFTTMANAPLVGQDTRRCSGDLPDRLSEIFLAGGLDSAMNEPMD